MARVIRVHECLKVSPPPVSGGLTVVLTKHRVVERTLVGSEGIAVIPKIAKPKPETSSTWVLNALVSFLVQWLGQRGRKTSWVIEDNRLCAVGTAD